MVMVSLVIFSQDYKNSKNNNYESHNNRFLKFGPLKGFLLNDAGFNKNINGTSGNVHPEIDMPASYSRLLGVVGKPNTGKSTFFSAATFATAEIANYPFTTIKPNRGVGYVRTPCVHTDFKVQDNPNNSLCIDGVRLAPVELIDIAGIVPGAWEGRGLGNQFLDEIRRADALIHIVDASGGTDCEGKSCKPGEHDPVEDVQFLEREITMWMASILRKDWPKIARTAEIDKKGGMSISV